jgi:uncharacterized protein YciI
MALFALHCLDKPGGLALRMATRPDHLAYLDANVDRIRAAGPYLDHGGEAEGSLLIIEAADLQDARAFAAADPYAQAGLFSHTEVRPLRMTYGVLK